MFPGKNELDQIKKIHNVLGTPNEEKFKEFQNHASHMQINFPQKEGTGIDSLLPHVSETCKDLIKKLLIYDEEQRLTASQALSHSYFKDVKDEVVLLGHTPSISDSDCAAGDKEGNKKILPLISKANKSPSYSKITITLDKTAKNLPQIKQSSPYGKKHLHKAFH